ncbi:MAG: DEAD/DEAH box helicase family protein [Anaerolineae bacterium]|nr:DEAD/DEAH box helicase family protein [Anaerolineae bacterium]
MPRLTSLEKGGFYAFNPAYLPHVASLFAPTANGGRLLDPCAGEGDALQHLAQAWGLTPYANELDTERAAACLEKFGAAQAVQGDLFQLRASTNGFLMAWVNPPYTWDLGSDEKRRELSFLKHSLKWVQNNGYIAWVVYAQHVTAEAAAVLAKNCSQVDIWEVPELHLGEYRQVVVIGHIGKAEQEAAAFAQMILHTIQQPHLLAIQAEPPYTFSSPQPLNRFLFAPKILTPEITLAALQTGSAHHMAQFQTLLEPPPPIDEIRPIVQPRGMQIGLVLAAGMFNGLILNTPEHGRAAVRSTIRTVEELREAPEEINEDDPTTTEREVYRTRPVVTITLLTERGEMLPMTGDAALVNFIADHKAALLDYLDAHFKPLYDFNYAPLAPVLNRVRIGKGLFTTQKHVIAATYTALQQRKGIYLVGEPGVGKSVMGAALAAAMQPQMQPDQVVIVMSPPHLVEKWKREIGKVTSSSFVEILENVDETRAFMDKCRRLLPHTLKVGIIARERAKLGEGWEAAVQWHKRHTALWKLGTEPPDDLKGKSRLFTQEIPLCPACGAVVTKDQKGEKVATGAWLNDAPRTCYTCGGVLWQDKRTFSAPKNGEKFPRKNPRMALADYIARVHPGRVYLYIADEVHELKSLSSDQGDAFTVLCNTAEKVIGLTGTLYGGVASSIFGLEYQLNPRVIRRYNWGERNADKGKQLARWVDQMGSLERIVEYKPQYDQSGHYTGKARFEHQPREAPGTSPMLVREILDHALFVGLTDISDMPPYEEIPVPLDMDADLREVYDDTKQALGEYLFQCRLEGDASFLGRYLRTLLSYPNAPFRAENIIHRRKLRGEDGTFMPLEKSVWAMPNLGEDRLYTKEQWLIDTVRSELAQGRKVGIFVEQSATRDIQPRLADLLTQHIPHARPFILYGKVDPKKREAVLEAQLKAGCNIFLANPKLVQTGLDLVAFPTLIFYEINYSLYVTIQASRRAWRIIQSEPCKTFYPYYTDSMEARAVALIGRKQRAAKLLYGDNDIGLSELTDGGDEANDLIAELAKSLDEDAGVTDLRDLFKAASSAEERRESLWAVEAAEEAHPESQSFVIERWLAETQTWQIISRHVNGTIPVNVFSSCAEAEQMAQQLAAQTRQRYRIMGYPDPQAHFIQYQGLERQIVQQTAQVSLPDYAAYDVMEQCAIELGGTLDTPPIMADQPPAKLPPKPRVQRRRRVSLSAAPDDLAPPAQSTKPPLPQREPAPVGEVRQLALFDV